MDLIKVVEVGIAIACAIIFLGRQGAFFGYILWIWLFVLGQRTFHITNDLSIHPLQAVIVLIIARIVLEPKSPGRSRLVLKLPALYAFALFWPYGIFVGRLAGFSYPRMFQVLFNYIPLLLMPIMLGSLARREKFWSITANSLLFAGTLVSLFGLVEIVFPGFQNLFPSTSAVPYEYHDEYSFARAGFKFWGGPAASMITALGLPFAIYLFPQVRALKRVIILVAVVISFTGIYFGGYRSVWIITAAIVAIVLSLRFKYRGIILSCILLSVAYYVAPESGKARLFSVTTIKTQEITDTSLQKRWGRAQDAYTAMLEKPWGWGFTASGWAHSDLLQIGVELSVVALGIFVFWYLSTLYRLLRKIAAFTQDGLLVSLAGSLVVAGGLFIFEGVTVSAWLVLPCWFVWILAEVRLRELTSTKGRVPSISTRGSRSRGRNADRLGMVQGAVKG